MSASPRVEARCMSRRRSYSDREPVAMYAATMSVFFRYNLLDMARDGLFCHRAVSDGLSRAQ